MEKISAIEINKLYLRYLENKELRKLDKVFSKEDKESDELSYSEKIIFRKCYKLYKQYLQKEGATITFKSFLESQEKIDDAAEIFRTYFFTKGYNTQLSSAIKKVKDLLQTDLDAKKHWIDYTDSSLRKDRLEEQLVKVLWYVIPEKKGINVHWSKEIIGVSLHELTNIEDFSHICKFLSIGDFRNAHEGELMIIRLNLYKKFRSKKIKYNELEEEYTRLQAELKKYYDLALFYYF
ncbi:hypothetical protein [Streptococcus sp. A22]|uniref:hypothetical protein n=1 Tax=Streptococcus sp. A22 TaxID=3373126 RepID=UPI002AACCEAA|nr:hypothetical protein [Streptococcus suis]